MTPKSIIYTFSQFLAKFPEIELPITLTDDSHHVFSKNNEPFPTQMIQQFFAPYEKNCDDEFTEFIPCFMLPDTPELHVIVYWKASLMNYEYIIASFTKKGDLIDRKVIAGSMIKDNQIVKSVATIDQDWMIYIVGGISRGDTYDATASKNLEMELLPDGKILSDVKW